MDYAYFQAWRRALKHIMRREPGVLQNIVDALLLDSDAQAAIELTQCFAFARRWPSFYQGVQRGRLDRAALRRVYADAVPVPPPATRLVLALDTTSLLRPLSPTGRDRAFVHTASPSGGAKPVGIGWQFSVLAVLPETPSSWTYYLDGTRLRTGSTAAVLGAAQLASVLPHLPRRARRPVLLGDRYYGSSTFVHLIHALPCAALLRMQAHRVFYRPAPPRDPHRRGRPRRHGPRFKGSDPTTHGAPDREWQGTDARGRAVTVSAWDGLAFADDPSLTVTVLRCTRQDGPASKRHPREIWLLWDDAEPAPLAEIPDLYTRRFSVEHGFRYDKQQLLWDDPRLRTPRQMQLWSDLVFMAHNTLVAAQDLVRVQPLPWERPQADTATPAQVRRALAPILPTLDPPAPAPQPRGKSPGRRQGATVTPATRYSVVKKTPRRKKEAEPAAA